MRIDAILLSNGSNPGGAWCASPKAAALTTLHGASQLAAAAPGFGEPFHIVTACGGESRGLGDDWPDTPPITSHAWAVNKPNQGRPAGSATCSPASIVDFHPGDGVVTVLGLHRVGGGEEAVRAGADVTVGGHQRSRRTRPAGPARQ